MSNILLDIKNLKIWYKTYRGYAQVVDGINLHINKGEKVGLVGESGCGKTSTVKTVLKTIDASNSYIPEGEIFFHGKDILKMNKNDLQEVRRKKIAMISQEPSAALNPVFTIGQTMGDVIKFSIGTKKLDKSDVHDMSVNAIKNVMISDPERILNAYPHQLSGGMKQRICIAMSLLTERDLLMADEPGTALDVTIQDQIHRLLKDLVVQKGMSLIMITHSLGVARELVDRIYVMYAGNIVEVSETKELFKNPLHPYTIGLMSCVPRLSGGGVSEGIYGYIPSYINPTKGCRFYPRCSKSTDKCKNEKPPLIDVNDSHKVACFNYK
ncbi:MAG: ABC transporter ATP-binding protein [Sedimentibacter sp.]